MLKLEKVERVKKNNPTPRAKFAELLVIPSYLAFAGKEIFTTYFPFRRCFLVDLYLKPLSLYFLSENLQFP